jgi:hypothetical protein
MKKLIFLFLTIVFMSQYTVAQVPNYVPTDGLVGYWPFDSNANDASGNGINGTNIGATLTADRFGNSNSAYSFDGDDWIEVFHNQILNFGINSFTLSCWSTKEGGMPFQHLITKNYITQWGDPDIRFNFVLRYEFDGLALSSGGLYNTNGVENNGILSSSPQNNLNDWNHFVGVFDTTNQIMQIYMNGNIIASGEINSSLQNYDSTGNMYFGVEHPTVGMPSGPQFLTGKLDDIGIWNRALTQEEITTLYESEVLSTNTATYESNINIYPNPANDQITIDFGNLDNVEDWNIKIINILGQEVLSQPMNTDKINVSELSKGVYIVRISDGVNQADKKFIKN